MKPLNLMKIIMIYLNKVIDIIVEESKGEIFAGAGTGTTGSSISMVLKKIIILG